MQNVEVLNDLIKINNDREEGYKKAAMQTADEGLKFLFEKLASQSNQFAKELERFVRTEGEEPTEGTTTLGKVYKTWMDIKATFGGDDKRGILASCEFGEDAAQKAYKQALEDDDISTDIRLAVNTQKSLLKEAHDQVKRMRDAQPA